MTPDKNGFRYPNIDISKCIDCGLCRRVCPNINHPHFYNEGSYYMGWNKDKKILLDSSSGGFFSALAFSFLDQGGVVFGAYYDDNNQLYHRMVESYDELELLRKSKYFQSDTKSTYLEVVDVLKNNRYVLFAGTPCQIAGLKEYAKLKRANCDRLYTAEVLCHGVTNEFVIKSFISDLSKYERKHVKSIVFRTKDNGWSNGRGTVIKVTFDDLSCKMAKPHDDLFYCAFNSNLILRESCYKCMYAQACRNADFTMGDFWGVKLVPKEYLELGVSTFTANSEKAICWIGNIEKYFYFYKINAEDVFLHNRAFRMPSEYNKKRDKFFSLYRKIGFYYAYFTCYPIYWLKWKIKATIGEKRIAFIKRMVHGK